MSELKDAQARWFRGEDVPGVAYRRNHSVQVTVGEHAGQPAAVIALERLEPEPTYLLALAAGRQLMVLERQIQPAG